MAAEEVKISPEQEAVIRDLLPPTMLNLVQLVGLAKAIEVVDRLGGTTWTTTLGKTSRGKLHQAALEEIVGKDVADKISRTWIARGLYIPRCTAALRRLRDMDINAHYVEATRHQSSNEVVNDLARRYKLSDRRVWDILKQPTVRNTDTPSLF